MALEQGPIYVDSKTVSSAGTPEALTTREIQCSSVFIQPLSTNCDSVYIVDSVTGSKTLTIPSSGISVPVQNPALIKIDVGTNDEGVEWLAV